ncbi:MAG: redoxin domain-containing protein [Bryobacterales bacterium]|nr:redoxin domain-containing protein [Bryobacterales bacterium]
MEKTPGMMIVRPPVEVFRTGPDIGERLPEFTLPDQHGRIVRLSGARAGRPAVVHFFRTVRWCPFCVLQLIDLQEAVREFESERIPVFAICNEPVDVLAEFAQVERITYSLLSDSDASYIRTVGVLNTAVAADDPAFGMPYPGSFLINREGRVFEKRFHPDVRVREPMSSLLLYFRLKEYSERLEEMVLERTRDLQQAQLQLVETARHASLGKLIAAINHELNTPVGALVSGIESVWRFYDRMCSDMTAAQRERLLALKEAIDGACARIARLAADLREFARLDGAEVGPVDLRHSLDVTVEVLGGALHRGVRVERRYPDTACWHGRGAPLNQALLEILTNAAEAMPAGGTLTLEVDASDKAFLIVVTDSGSGIPEQERHQLFEPHLRAKGDRIGMALGLPLAHRIVRDQGGELKVLPGTHGGTRVEIHLPR